MAREMGGLWVPPMPKRQFRRFTRRKQRRREEQRTLDSVYRLSGTVAALLWVVKMTRCFTCPRCEGHGQDPEHNDGGTFNRYGEVLEPPGPVDCDFCGGSGVLDPQQLVKKTVVSNPWPMDLHSARSRTSGNDRVDALAYALRGLKS